jgi:flagellar hook-associated protein 1
VSDLFTSLSSAARALEAQRFGLDVTGQNIANVNTPGWSKRVAEFAAVPGNDNRSPGRGVDVVGVRAMRDQLIERRLLQELPAERRQAAIAESLHIVESVLGDPGSSIDERLTRLFDAFSQLAESPTSAVARQEVLLQGQAIASAFRNMVGRFETSQRDTDNKVRAAVEDVTSLAQRIAALNVSIGKSGAAGTALHLQDEQQQLVRELSEQLDVDVLRRDDGGVDISYGNGRSLVIGENSYDIRSASTPPDGFASVIGLNDVDVTAEITGGRLGGLLQVRDVNIPDYLSRLDTLASELVGEVNTLHAAGYDLNGATGQDFFGYSTAPTGTAGAAKFIQLDPAVAGNASLIAAAGVAEAGDNTTASALAGLREARVLDGNTATLSDGWSRLVYRIGRDTQAAVDEQTSREEIVKQVDALRDQVSGISLDEEAMWMLKFQRAYEANARFFSAVDRLLDTLLQSLGR